MDDNQTSTTDTEARSELSRFLGKEVWPADRSRLLQVAQDNDATDAVLARLGQLPVDKEYRNVQDVAVELGLASPATEGAGAD